MTSREAAIEAIAQGRAKSVDLMEDDGYGGYRIQVWFIYNGQEYCYESKPFHGTSYQDLAREAAIRVERLGVPRATVLKWLGTRFEIDKIDTSAIFGKKKK